jgi:hypothetical protein
VASGNQSDVDARYRFALVIKALLALKWILLSSIKFWANA